MWRIGAPIRVAFAAELEIKSEWELELEFGLEVVLKLRWELELSINASS